MITVSKYYDFWAYLQEVNLLASLFISREYIKKGILRNHENQTCNIFMRTTSSLLGSVPTNLACVTASARFSTPELEFSAVGSTGRKRDYR